jgi:hypothetical protein
VGAHSESHIQLHQCVCVCVGGGGEYGGGALCKSVGEGVRCVWGVGVGAVGGQDGVIRQKRLSCSTSDNGDWALSEPISCS